MSGSPERMTVRALAVFALLLLGGSDPDGVRGAVDLGGFDLPAERIPLWTDTGAVPPDTSTWQRIDAARPPPALGCAPVRPDDDADDAPALDCLVSGAPDRSVIALPSGTLQLKGGVSIRRSRVVLRGAGMGLTRLHVAADAAPRNYTAACDRPAWLQLCEPTAAAGPEIAWVGGYRQGAREIEVERPDGIAAGAWILLEQDLPERDRADTRFRGREAFRWMTRVVATRGRRLHIDPPLLEDFVVGGQRVRRVPMIEHVGLEHLTLYRSDPTLGGLCDSGPGKECSLAYDPFVRLWRVAHGWLERVEMRDNYSHFAQARAAVVGWTVRASVFRRLHRDRVPHQSAVLLQGAYGCVFENNRIEDVARWITLEAGARGNVIAYNYESPLVQVSPAEGRTVFFHGHYPGANLVEGNHLRRHVSQDNYWGRQGRHNTFFRNRVLHDAWRVCTASSGERTTRACLADEDCNESAGERCLDDLRSGFEAHADGGCEKGADPDGEPIDSDGNCTAIAFESSYLANSGSALYPTPAGRRTPATTPLLFDWPQAKNSRGLVWGLWLEKNLMRTALRADATFASRGSSCGNGTCAAHGPFVGDNYVGVRAPAEWRGFEGPDSLYRSEPPPWWCREACPYALEQGIGAFGDDLHPDNVARLCPLPAQLAHEARVCTPLSGGAIPAAPSDAGG